MPEVKKAPKLPKAPQTPSSTPSKAKPKKLPPRSPSKSTTSTPAAKPAKLPPKTAPSEVSSSAPPKCSKPSKLGPKQSAEPPTPAKTPKQAPKSNPSQTPSKPDSSSFSKYTRPSIASPKPSATKLRTLEPKPALTPSQSASSLPLSSSNKSTNQSRKPSLAPKAPSTPQASTSQRPKPTPAQSQSNLSVQKTQAPKPTPSKPQSNISVPKAQATKDSSASQKLAATPKKSVDQSAPKTPKPKLSEPAKPAPPEPKPTNDEAPPKTLSRKQSSGPPNPDLPVGKESPKPPVPNSQSKDPEKKPVSRKPSIGPRSQSNDAESKPAPRKPSIAPRKSSTQVSLATPKKREKDIPEEDEDPSAHKLSEENRNLKDILSESQCADLTILLANITERMRQSIENTFDAAAGLNLLGQGRRGKDGFKTVDFDPGTVDVGAYDKERKVEEEQKKELAKPQNQKLKKDALRWFDEWRQGVIQRVGEAVNSKKTATEQKDEAGKEDTAAKPTQTQPRLQRISTTGKGDEYEPPKLEDIFPRIRTPLTKLPLAQRALVLHSVFLLLLGLEHYNAASRVLLLHITSSLKLGLNSLREDEEKTAQGLLEAAKQMDAEQEKGKKRAESQEARKWKIRLASAAGAAIIGYTGGMAAPMVAAGVGTMMGELGLGATTAASYLGAVAGNTAIVGSLFGAYGGRMTGQIMSNISAEVEDFAFLPVHGERKEHAESLDAATDERRLRVIVAVSGWLLEKEEVVSPWRVLKPSAEVFALRFELEALMNLGQSFDTMLSSAAYSYAQSAVAKRTVFSELMSAMWPVALVKVARVVDNPFSLAKARAEKAGEVLAEAIMNRAQGERPVTLVGYSLGARVIWSCLMTLAKKRGFGFVESAVMMGSPIPSDVNTWRTMRSTVSGRLVNVYSENDYLLAFLYRSASLQYGVAGLMPVTGLSGVENVDVSEMVSGHLRYRYLVGAILDKIRFEDVDKAEVAKEAKAFEALVEEEKKNTYQKQLKENAGTLYDQYGERLGLPKEGRKLLPQKEQELNDDKANKEASKMEKEISQKTQKGLMQWAVEQLYISPPDAPSAEDAKNTAADPKAAAGKAQKDAKKTTDAATKTLYQRASEAMYLSRSGGPEGEAAAKEKISQAPTGEAGDSSSYLSTAAGYIPTGYLPSLRSSPKKSDPPKKLGETAKQPSTLSKSKSKSRASAQTLKDPTTAKVNGDAQVPKADDKKEEVPDKVSESTKDVPKKGTDTADPFVDSNNEAQKPSGYSSYLPSLGFGSSTSDKAENDREPPKTPTKSSSKGAEGAKQEPSPQKPAGGKETDKQPSNSGGYGSYLPSFGSSRSEDKEKPPQSEGKAPEKDAQDSGNKDQDNGDEKPKEQPNTQENSGYSSYLPSFGFGSSTDDKTQRDSKKDPQPQESPADKKDDAAEEPPKGDSPSKDDPSQPNDSSESGKDRSSEPEKSPTQRSPEPEKPSQGTPAKKYPWETVLEEGGGVEPADQTSSYTSYIPSFGFGGSSSQTKDSSAESPDAKKPTDDAAKSNEDQSKPADQPSKQDEDPPKKKYPWEAYASG